MEIVGAILPELYACVGDPALWPRVLDRIGAAVGAHGTVIQLLAADGDRLRQRWIVRDTRSSRDADVHDARIDQDENPRLALSRTGHGNGVARDRDRFDPDCRQLKRFHEQLASIGFGTYMSAFIPAPDATQLSLVFHKHVDDRHDFSPRDEAIAGALMPHIGQVARLHHRFAAMHDRSTALEAAADRIGDGLVICDRYGAVRWSNRAAERILANSPHVRLVQGRVRCPRSADAERLSALLARASDAIGRASGNHCLRLGHAADADALQLLAIPTATDAGGREGSARDGAVSLYLSEGSARANLSQSAVQELFGLTSAEARLTVALCHGATLAEFATSAGVSVGTARIQLKQVFAKTRSHRQSELVRRVCGSLASRAR